MNETVQTLHQQLKELGIHFLGYRFMIWNDKAIKVFKGNKGVIITYNESQDLYEAEKYKGLKIEPKIVGLFAEDLVNLF